jgi:hypothetical protein
MVGSRPEIGVAALVVRAYPTGAKSGIVVKTGVKAGGINCQRNQTSAGVKVRTGVRGGGLDLQHSRAVRRG